MTVSVAGNITNPTSMVILLHGYGANGQDLISLADEWAAALPRTVFIAPDAPEACEMTPFGFQWFSLADWSPLALDAGARRAAPWIMDFITTQMKHYDIKPSQVALCGFSQGTMMSLYVALRHQPRLAGVLGYSGALLCTEEWPRITLEKPPICLVHGIADAVVPVAAYYHAAQALEAEEFDFEGHVLHGLMHGINPYGMELGRTFLTRVLGP